MTIPMYEGVAENPPEKCTYWVCRLKLAGGGVVMPIEGGVEGTHPGICIKWVRR